LRNGDRPKLRLTRMQSKRTNADPAERNPATTTAFE